MMRVMLLIQQRQTPDPEAMQCCIICTIPSGPETQQIGTRKNRPYFPSARTICIPSAASVCT